MDEGRKTTSATDEAAGETETERFYQPVEHDDTIVKRPITFEIKESLDIVRTPRGGEALIGDVAHLAIHVKRSDTPLHVEVKDQFVIGRSHAKADDKPDLDLKRYGAQLEGVSRRHVLITKDGNTLKVEDLNTTNGTYLNGFRLLPGEARFLRDGDELHLGQFVMRVFYRMSGINEG